MPDTNRIALRNEVKELLSLIGEKPTEFWEVFADELKRRDLLLAETVSEEDKYGPMSYEDALKFGRKTITFGKHSGKAYADTPYEYLAWLADNNIPLLKYVKYRGQLEPPDVD